MIKLLVLQTVTDFLYMVERFDISVESLTSYMQRMLSSRTLPISRISFLSGVYPKGNDGQWMGVLAHVGIDTRLLLT
jgi:hypothetical protein